jgi:hypothetical protein
MAYKFEWNEFADQPHNVAPRWERRRHHLRHWRTYFSMAWADLVYGLPGLTLYRCYRRRMFREPVVFAPGMFGLSVSPGLGGEDVIAFLKEAGARETLVRVASWERDRLDDTEAFVRSLRAEGIGVALAVLQRRQDVLEPQAWKSFLADVFGRFSSLCTAFEVGHAWNRTKWGVWDYTEYLTLAQAAFDLRPSAEIKLVGPAVIDFEFHLYPPTLRSLPFDKVSSLLYVDRVGAPENAQFGWTTEMKVALFKAVADRSAGGWRDAWITEVNWPLEGTGRYSPAAGRPNVSEETQADYLVRYYLISLAGGLIERVYWWQLAAPGYGLVDSGVTPWRRRPSFAAFRTMTTLLSGATFVGRDLAAGPRIFRFRKATLEFAVCWTPGRPCEHEFETPAAEVLDRDGKTTGQRGRRIRIDGSPRYVFF